MASKLLFLLCIICFIRNSVCEADKVPENQKDTPHNDNIVQGILRPETSVKKELKPSTDASPNNSSNNTDSNVHNILKNDESVNNSKDGSQDVESGAVIRGVLVFVGIGLIFVIYLGFKTYRKRKVPLIKKYGVRGRRSDVEMRPLPLDDDEDDETVFDLGSLNKP